MVKYTFWKICQIIFGFIIVLFFYFVVQTWFLQFLYFILYLFEYLYKIFMSIALFLPDLNVFSDTSSLLEGFINNLRSTSSVKHLLANLNYTKLWINHYFYSKYAYGTYYVNTAQYYVINWKPFWYFGIYDLNSPKYALILKYLDKHDLTIEIPTIQALDYFWGSYRWRVTEGDLTLMPGNFYQKMFKRFLKRALRWNYYFSAQFIYIPAFSYLENIIFDYSRIFISDVSWLFYFIIFKCLHYSVLITMFFWIILVRFLMTFNFFYDYLNLYVRKPLLYRTKNYFIIISLVSLFLFFFTINFGSFIYIYIFFIFLLYLIFFVSFSTKVLFLQRYLLKILLQSLRQKILSLKGSIKAKTKKGRLKQLQKIPALKVLFQIYKFLYFIQKKFIGYNSYQFYTNLRLCKQIRYLKRRGGSFDFWANYKSPLLVNPYYYSDIFIPSALKGSRGGLWLRTTHKDYAKHLMYENTDALRFFNHHDSFKYFIWEPQYEYGLHFYNQRELVFLNSDNLFNFLFSGVREVFTNSSSKAHVIGGVSHYDIYRQRLTAFDINTYLVDSPGAHVSRWYMLRLYWIYMYIAPIVIKIIYKIYYYFFDLFYYLSFFLTGLLRWRAEITSYDTDPDHISYLKFLEFYKLFSYKYFDYYLTKQAPYLFKDSTRLYQVYFLKELDGWVLRYKFFELDQIGYFMANGALQQALLAAVPLLVLKMAKWSLLFYKHVPLEFLFFAIISFISKIWFFHKFFFIFDRYIYKCAHASIWAKKKFVFNSGHVRFHHYFLRCRWKLNKRVTPQMGHGRHLHSRKSHYEVTNFF